jgi:hypothetical protein
MFRKIWMITLTLFFILNIISTNIFSQQQMDPEK